ncbi:ankyrin repeat domain-containing protein [Streptomyces sp. NPDC007088]|uniref:ankyrin repeat domain-containing protein n=1 Tax=Streptomyces sp. NPDC007088 TaxID=3364773 RepID=UPI0036BF1917
MFAAVEAGDEDAVLGLLRRGVSARSVDARGQTALYAAAVRDEPGVVRLLLAAGADPDELSGAGDLPLCGAACGGHVGVVRALLAAGAKVDGVEEFGFRALDWAVALGFAGVAEVLLAAGADPDRAAPGGERPLVVAAAGGSFSTVRCLRAYGARGGRAALAAAWAALSGDVRADAERAALEGAGGAGPGVEVFVREVVEDGGLTVVAEAFRAGLPVGSAERRTGHGAVCTLLEREAGIVTARAELAGRALRDGVRGRGLDNWARSVGALVERRDEETFAAVAAWCAWEDEARRALAADVLAGWGEARAVPLLRGLARRSREPEPLVAVAAALARYGDPAAVPELVALATRPWARVRAAVAGALAGRSGGVGALVALARDPVTEVRERAAEALRDPVEPAARAGGVREALAGLLDDHSPVVRAHAAAALARRGDPRAVPVLAALLADSPPGEPARALAVDAVALVADAGARRRLAATAVRVRAL